MNKKYYVLALLICLILIVSACKKGGAAAGTAPRTPFIGGTAGITINFEKDSPPPEVTDRGTFPFNAIIRLKNDGEFKVTKDNIKLNLIGFDPEDFGVNFENVKDVQPTDNLESKKKDAEGNIIEGTTTFATFPKETESFNVEGVFSGNTEFTFRTDVCYHYETESNTKLCALRDMINVRDDSICKPTGSKTVHTSSAPVQVTNLRQSVIGQNKISFNFDISLSGNVDIFQSDLDSTSLGDFDQACPKAPKDRRAKENKVSVEVIEIPDDPVIQNIKCGGLDAGHKGVVILVSGKRTITCTADIVELRNDFEKVIGINLAYNVLDNKETKVLVKHLADVNP